MVAALIKFTQGSHTDNPGKAVLGEHGDFSLVTVTNGVNTGVVSWKIYLLDAPSDSATFAPGSQPQILAQAVNNTPTTGFSPDVAGTYRVMLEVVDGGGVVDRDIRCFGIPDARGFLRPPFQENPAPLPIAVPGIIADGPRPTKPDEQNYGDNVRGWAGDADAGQLDAFLRRYADMPCQFVDSTPFEASVDDAPLHLVDLPAIGGPAEFVLPDAPRVGFVVRIAALGTGGTNVTVTPAGGGTIAGHPSVVLRSGSGLVLAHRAVNGWVIVSRGGAIDLNVPGGVGDAGKLAIVNEAGDNIQYADPSAALSQEVINWAATQTFSGALVLGTVQYQAVPGSTVAVTLGANVTRLYLFDGDAEILSISGASDGRMLLVHVVSGTKRFAGGFYLPGNAVFYAGPSTSVWLHSRDGSWVVGETVPIYTPPSSGAIARTVTSRLNDDVHVADFMTPAQIADANNGTKLFDMQPAIQAAIDWLLFGSLGFSGNVRGRLRLPAGHLRIDRTIHVNYGLDYRTLIVEGEGILRGGEGGQTGTVIIATFGDAPAIAVSAGMDVVIKQLQIVGLNRDHIFNTIAGGPILMSHLDPQTWVDPALPASASSRYAPYAGIAIDPYTGAQPGVHYPDVPFPAGFGSPPQYGKAPSTEITIEDVRIDGFVVGVVLQPGDYDGSGDYVRLNRVQMWWCTYGLSWGNSQARAMSVNNSTFAWLHTVFLTNAHGRQIGMPQFAVTSCSFMTSIQLFELKALGYGLGPTFINCFSEAMYRLGYCNGQSTDACGLTFRSCEFGFSWWDRYGVPTWLLECQGAHQVIFDTTFFYNTSVTNGWMGFRCSGSNFLNEPARQLQFVGSQSILPESGTTRAERCATNATQGLVVSKGSTSVDRFSLTCGYTFNLDTGLEVHGPQLYTEQHTAERRFGAPVYAKKLKSMSAGNDPGIDVAWRVRTLSITTVVSTVGRTVTITISGVTAVLLAHYGGDVGDVVIYGGASGDGAAFNIRSRTGTTLVLYAMNGFDKDGNLLTPVVAGVNVLWPINCRRFVPSRVIYADMTAGSPTLTNVIDGTGAPVTLPDHFYTGDFIYVDDEVDRFIEPTTDTTLVSMDDTAKTLTFGGNFLFTRTRMRLGVFVRAAMPNV